MVGNNAWVRYVTRLIERDFPNLTVCGYRLTSPDSPDYNCVAWAADDDQRWWWPDADGIHYCPPNIPRELTLEAFQEAYQTLGYQVCQDDTLEEKYQKIAIYKVLAL